METNYSPLPQQTDHTTTSSNVVAKGLFKGRLNRINYLIGVLLISIIFFSYIWFTIQFYYLLPNIRILDALLRITTLFLFAFYGFSFGIRRLHDLGMSGWLMLLILIPPVFIIFFLYLIFKKGKEGDNKYGSPQRNLDFKQLFVG